MQPLLRTTMLAGALALATLAAPSAEAGKADDQLVVGGFIGYTTVDSIFQGGREVRILRHLIDEALFGLDQTTGKYVPTAAKSYKYADPKTMDIELREDVKFHDGSLMTADDIVYSFNEYLKPEYIKTSTGAAVDVWLARAEKKGPHSVRLHLKEPWPHVIVDLAESIPVKKAGSLTGKPNNVNIGTGPYKVVSFTPQQIVLERFDDFFLPSEKGKVKTIRLRHIPDWGTQQAEIISGGIDFMYDVPPEIGRNMGKMPGIVDQIVPASGVQYFALNTRPEVDGKPNPLSKLEVRRAMAYAINRQAMMDTIHNRERKVLHSSCLPGQLGCELDVTKYEFDPAKAKKLLADAGYPNGFDMTIWVYRDADMVESMASDLQKVGIRANLRTGRQAAVEQLRAENKVQAFLGLYGNNSQPDSYRILFQGFSLKHPDAIPHDAEASALLDDIAATPDIEARNVLFSKVLKLIADRVLWLPVSGVVQHWVMRDGLVAPAEADGSVPRYYRFFWK